MLYSSMVKVYLTLSILIISKLSFACTCEYFQTFSLALYDSYKDIVEVKIEKVHQPIQKSYDSTEIPPPPIVSLNAEYKVTILEVYKGDLTAKDSVFSFEIRSSCGWEPKLGSTFIFYLYNDQSRYNIDMCTHTISKESNHYESERQILRQLSDKKGAFSVKQSNHNVLEGQFKNSKREGIWKIYIPDLFKSEKQNESVEPDLVLTYKKGELTNVQPAKDFNRKDWVHMFTLDYFYDLWKGIDGE
ncbi:hypothetical protein K6119_06915 [Paracrocinitomix mangrovi]|uniref:hypothetical protein n=1 Tax=Paracrocinitomix mangrovi TaxID=2862509 RepID=UPI001C8E3993|nr:hypothetical protein [Paracrocinitomix mangrovi]UKN03244.1 hypothetical protein K6119_06915 [Paracrocinitomix mangrovi]